MRLTGILAGVLALGWATGALAAPTAIQTTKLSDGRYRLVLKARDLKGPAEGQDRMEATARNLCGAEAFQFDRYQFDILQDPDLAAAKGAKIAVLTQEIFCGQALLETVNSSPGANWKPSDKEVDGVRRLTETFFDQRAAQKYDQAYALLSPKMQATVTEPDWIANVRAFDQKSGPRAEQQIRGVAWHNNTEVEPRGVFMVVSTMSRYANGAACGYVVWERVARGDYLMIREVSDFMVAPDLAALDDTTVSRLQGLYHCV